MSKKKINKLILGLSITTMLLNSNLKNCYAAYVGFGTLSDGGGGSSEIKPIESGEKSYKSGTHKYVYSYKKILSSNSGMDMNGYNLDGTNVMPITTTIDHTKHIFKSGTWIGINITETQNAYWEVIDFEAKEIKKVYNCVYSKESISYSCNGETIMFSAPRQNCLHSGYTLEECSGVLITGSNPTMYSCTCTKKATCTKSYDDKTAEPVEKNYYELYECPKTKNFDGVTYNLNKDKSSVDEPDYTAPLAKIIEMKQKARDETHKEALSMIGAPLGMVQYANENSKLQLTGTLIKQNDTGTSEDSGTITKTYEYRQEKVCINLKTGKVTYDRDCDEEELRIYNKQVNGSNLKYWHYFIPLNTKSGKEEFYLEIVPNAKRKLDPGSCEDAMKKYATNYKNYIIPDLNGGKFTGDYPTTKKNSDMDIIKSNNGCYFATTIYIPTVQKFYNEQADGTFKGFNFYYKPIDVNNPFPNGLPSNSIWTTETINKIKGTSNQNVTYYANVTNAKAIRNYKNKETNYKKNLYTSWENMQLNGVSNFIENEGIVKRYVQKTDFYKLGCGPANEKKTNSDGTTNYLYQQECGT